jgi:hypothetical protein
VIDEITTGGIALKLLSGTTGRIVMQLILALEDDDILKIIDCKDAKATKNVIAMSLEFCMNICR